MTDFPLENSNGMDTQNSEKNQNDKDTNLNQEQKETRQGNTKPRDKIQSEHNNNQPSTDTNEIKLLLGIMEAQIKHLDNEIKTINQKHLDEIMKLKNQINTLENKEEIDPNTKPTKPSNRKLVLNPTLQLNEIGNFQQEQTKQKLQPIDYTKVNTARKILEPRPQLSMSTHQEVEEKLKEHNIEVRQKIIENEIKLKKPKDMTIKQKEKIIENIFTKQSRTIGIAPMTKDHAHRVCEELTQKGTIKKSEDYQTRLQRTIKSLVKSCCKNNLGIGRRGMERNKSIKNSTDQLN